jgi:hypothetical protein
MKSNKKKGNFPNLRLAFSVRERVAFELVLTHLFHSEREEEKLEKGKLRGAKSLVFEMVIHSLPLSL